jgi:hypothetical protein
MSKANAKGEAAVRIPFGAVSMEILAPQVIELRGEFEALEARFGDVVASFERTVAKVERSGAFEAGTIEFVKQKDVADCRSGFDTARNILSYVEESLRLMERVLADARDPLREVEEELLMFEEAIEPSVPRKTSKKMGAKKVGAKKPAAKAGAK